MILLLLISYANSGNTQTNVSGYILSNTTWTLAGSPYIVTGNTLVNNGVTLTIEPGVVVKFDSTKALQINGTLVANNHAGLSLLEKNIFGMESGIGICCEGRINGNSKLY